MHRSMLTAAAACFLLSALPQATGQTDNAASSSTAPPAPSDTPANTLQPAGPAVQSRPPAKQRSPVGAITIGYFYLAPQSAPGTWLWHTQGFYGIGQINLKPWLSFIEDNTVSYNTGAGTHENIQSVLAGPLVTLFPKRKLSVAFFADAGKVRDSKAGTVTSVPVWATGPVLTYKLSKHIGLLWVPGEYVRSYQPNGPLNNFTSRFGFLLPIS